MAMGLQNKEMLANAKIANEDEYCFLPPMDLITKDLTVLREIVKAKLGKKNVAGPKDSDQGAVKDKNVAGPHNEGVSSLGKNKAEKAKERKCR